METKWLHFWPNDSVYSIGVTHRGQAPPDLEMVPQSKSGQQDVPNVYTRADWKAGKLKAEIYNSFQATWPLFLEFACLGINKFIEKYYGKFLFE